MGGIIMWAVRDKIGSLYLFDTKPYKDLELGIWTCDENVYEEWFASLIDSEELPEVKWEDEEPTEVELTIKHK